MNPFKTHPNAHTPEDVVYVKQEELYLSQEVIIIYGTNEPILTPLIQILQKLWYTWNKRNFICHIQISCPPKYKLITLPRLQLLAVSIAICCSQCVIKAIKWKPCSGGRDSLYKRLKKAVWSLLDKDHSFRFLKISHCFGKNWQDLSERKKR